MEFTVRHSIPGRVRLRVPPLRHRSALAESVLGWLKAQAGIKAARINYDCASLIIDYDRQRTDLVERLVLLLAGATLDQLRALAAQPVRSASPAPATPKSAPPRTTGRWPLVLPTISLALSFSRNPLLAGINAPLMLWNAYPIARRAWNVWRREGRLNVDFLDTLAVAASIALGNMPAGAIIVWLVRLGDWIRDLTAAGSKRAMSELLEFQHKTAWLMVNGQIVSVPATRLAAGDSVVVYPGEMIPVDGEILRGQALIDQKTITGESLPVTRSKGEAAFAATVIREGQLTIRAIRVGSATMAGQIARLVDAAPAGDTRMQNHAEHFADRLVTPTLAVAIGTAALTRDFNRFLSLVIVDYGTGIRVAAPTAVLSSMTHAARVGIIIKSGAHMERLAEIDTIVFDKTGTLTKGVPAVLDVISYQDKISPQHLLGLAVAAETRLQHPVAAALRAKARELALEIPPCGETQYRIGLGVEGQVNGYYLHVGSERFLQHSNIRVSHIAADRSAFDRRGYSTLYVAVDGVVAGLVPYADQIRPESRAVIQALQAKGIRHTVMLTGDNAVVARAVCDRLGLSRYHADMMPTDKTDVILELQHRGHRVAMVGDGINDSPALSYAHVGIAMKHGPEVTHESADVILMEDSLWKLVKAVDISRGAVRLIKQNYAIAAALNTLALGLALPGGLITPEYTALLSNGSAILASLNGIRPIMRYQ